MIIINIIYTITENCNIEDDKLEKIVTSKVYDIILLKEDE